MVQNRLGEWALARFVQRTKVRSPKMHQNFTVTNYIEIKKRSLIKVTLFCIIIKYLPALIYIIMQKRIMLFELELVFLIFINCCI